MNNSKKSHPTIFLILTCIFLSCIESKKESAENQLDTNMERAEMTSNEPMTENSIKNTDAPRLKYFYNTDSRNGMVTERIPFPKEWEQHKSGEFAFTGPNGVKVYGEVGQYYSYSNDPMMMNMYQQTGVKVKYPLSMDQTIEEILMPIANKVNRKLVKKYPITPLLEGYKSFCSMIYKQQRNPTQFDATALEWEDPDGTKWVTIFFYQFDQGQNDILWGFQMGAVGAPALYFEQARQDYLNGMLNRQINPEWIRTMNQQTQYAVQKIDEQTERQQAEFKRGMEQRQKQWEADQEMRANNQKQWEAGLEARSLRQEHIADVILGKTNIIDPETGTKTKINHTSNRYWVNTRGYYIGTNTTYDDPNKNAFINGETWREFKVDDYRN